MAAYTFTLGSNATNSYIGYSNYSYRSSYTPSATPINVNGGYVVTKDGNGVITSAVAATNKPIVITFFREIFPTNSGSSARLELDSSSTGTATYASSYRNCSGNEDVVPNYKMNAGTAVWYGFRTNSTAQLNFYRGATTGASDEIIRDANGTVTTYSTNTNLYARLDWYGAPAAPGSLTVSAVTLNSATLTWTKPTDMGGYTALTGYRVIYKKSSEDDTKWVSTGKIGGDTTLTYTVTGLAIGTSYDFKVAATNAATDIYNATYTELSSTVGTNASVTGTTVSGGIWDGSGGWVAPGVKVWDGSAWVSANLNVWTGTEWKRQ